MLPSLDAAAMAAGQGRPLVCALSGGGDSVALLLLLQKFCRGTGQALCAAHVHHHLRGDAADGDAAFCEALCASLDIPCTVLHVHLPEGGGVEEAARKARYAALLDFAKARNAHIVTAHNADDALETLIFHLCRGAAPGGLGMPAVRTLEADTLLLRPLLAVPGSALREYVRRRGYAWREDGTNADEAYTRNRIRARILPLLRDLHPAAAEHAAHTLALQAEDEAFLTQIAETALEGYPEAGGVRTLPCAALHRPRPIASRMVKRIHNRPDLTAGHIEKVLAMAGRHEGSETLALPGMTVQRSYDRLIFRRDSAKLSPAETAPIPIPGFGEYALSGWRIAVRPAENNAKISQTFHNITVDSRRIRGILILRHRLPGDCFRPWRGAGTVTLKKRCIDLKIPREARDRLPVLADDEGVVACALAGAAERVIALPDTDPAFLRQITFIREPAASSDEAPNCERRTL